MEKTLQALDKLNKEWSAKREYFPFVEDGILCAESWSKASPKIMILMKESHKKANWFHIAGTPIQAVNEDGSCKVIWKNILRWKYAIECIASGNTPEDFPALETLPDVKDRGGEISAIAYVNVSKALGETTSQEKILKEIAHRDKEFLTRQIDLIDPDIIICAKTFWPYHLAHQPNPLFDEISPNIHIHKGRIVIDFFHPGLPAGNKQKHLYDKLVKIISTPEAKKKILSLQRSNPSF